MFRSPKVRAFGDVPKAWIVAGRILLLLNAIVLLLIPITEQIWTWDRFLRGGEDLEFSVLALIAFCCLILVLAQHIRRAIVALSMIRTLFSRIPGRNRVHSLSLLHAYAIANRRQATTPFFGTYRNLLQI
jgi:hypothetical protein